MSLSETTFDFSDSFGTRGVLTVGNPAFGVHSSGGDADGFRLYLRAGVDYGILSGAQAVSVHFHLVDPNDNYVATSQQYEPGLQILEFTPRTSGIYRLSVQANDNPGAYGILYEVLTGGPGDDHFADFVDSVGMPPGVVRTGRLELGGDSDGFVVPVLAGQRHCYEFASGVSDLVVQFQDANYLPLVSNASVGGGVGSFTSPVSQNVLVVLSSASLEKTGTYSIAMGLTMSPTAPLRFGTAGHDSIVGGPAGEELRGGWGSDTLRGGGGVDFLSGGAGPEADTLDGGTGGDWMEGGRGDDTYVVDADDHVTERAGQGIDTILSSVSQSLGANLENLRLTGSPALYAAGNELANVLTGNGLANVLDGRGGADTLLGGAGSDTLEGGTGGDSMTGGDGNDQYRVDHALDKVVESGTPGAGIDTVVSTVGWTLGANVEHLTLTGGAAINGTGNALANRITGTAGANVLTGGAGNDTLDGGAALDTLDGGSGNDSYVVDQVGERIVESGTSSTEIDSVSASVSFSLGANVERLTLAGTAAIDGTGNGLANLITGNGAANRLSGGAGDDTLAGGEGNDTLDGGTGNDSMAGGAGNDRYLVGSTADKVVETGTSVTELDTVVSTVSWKLGSSLETLTLAGAAAIDGTGNAFANRVTGNGAANALNGNGGNDTLGGGGGDDTLDGGTGSDVMTGGAGNDRYVVDGSGDQVLETGTAETEVDMVLSSVSWKLTDFVERLTLTGSAAINGSGSDFANLIAGNAAANVLSGNGGNDTLAGGGGDDTLNGGAGNDAMAGGAGNDLYRVDGSGDTVVETGTSATEIDTVWSTASWTLGTNLEGLTLAGTAPIDGTGNGRANLITGNAAGNTLAGGGGNDTLVGAGGPDWLDGGIGSDSMSGGAGEDRYVVDRASDVVIETGTLASEVDQVFASIGWTLGANLEILALTGTAAIDGGGNGLANALSGNAAANRLSGLVGDDTLSGGDGDDTLDGGAGNDSLAGGTGRVEFRFTSALDAATNVDAVAGFQSGDNRIVLDEAVFAEVGDPGPIEAEVFRIGTAAEDDSDRLIYDPATGQLFYDADGNGGAAGAVLFATLESGTTLAATDFWVV